MGKKDRGFTLIELLVVVAIIGILAAVGVVAYNGYTASAKKGVAKSNHANAVKFITAEIAKCGVEDEVFVVGTASMTCNTAGYATIDAKAIAALNAGEFKNPFTKGPGAVAAAAATDPEGDVVITYDSATNTVTITTILESGGTAMVATAQHD